MNLQHITSSVTGFAGWSHAEKLKFFTWYLHVHRAKERVAPADLRGCYDALHLDKPSNVNPYLGQLASRKPREMLRDARGYYLEARVRAAFDSRFGRRNEAHIVDQLLADLPNKIPNLQERVFLEEALACFRGGAFRASIVMTWNLAFDHLCWFILGKHVVAFNNQFPVRFPKTRFSPINGRDDFTDLKESDVLDVCKSARIVSANHYKVLQEKLTRRNMAAHPSTVVITQLQAEDFINDLVNNVVLHLM